MKANCETTSQSQATLAVPVPHVLFGADWLLADSKELLRAAQHAARNERIEYRAFSGGKLFGVC